MDIEVLDPNMDIDIDTDMDPNMDMDLDKDFHKLEKINLLGVH